MFEIAKQFDFDYGHRVWTQTLDKKYSIDVQCVCKHFHGHRGTILLYLEGEDLNPQGMVWDFKNLNFFKKFIDDVLDHKMILDMHDPSLFHFFLLLKSKKKFSTIDNKTPFDSKCVDERYYLPNKKIISSIKDT
jgi:6-pyruvoyltetrahydropterin/6-carboxytetrahydropterin synthase